MKLLLTLGHNSSAILVDGDKVLCGYEEERLSKVKADSSFPNLSIRQILQFFPEAYDEVDEVCISHWFWDWDLTENKYYMPKFLAANFPNAKITSVNKDNTHHDLHAKSVWNFLDGDRSGLTIVADGFGNFGECLSIYIDGVLEHRSYNTVYSMGLMYQYAIRYLGMKENQDEYKLLGYEQQVDPTEKVLLADTIERVADDCTNNLINFSYANSNSMGQVLGEAWEHWKAIFVTIDAIELDRSRIAYFVQQVLERTMLSVVKKYKIKNIKVSGGVFYNVKLNNLLLRYSEKFEANPLAGDQGCAIGFLPIRYTNLFWGLRDINYSEKPATCITAIQITGYTNIMRGNMEFGPRALCNTTCLALPTSAVVNKINKKNKRDSVMPMAPVVTSEFMIKHFADIEKVGKSKYYMIIAYDYKNNIDDFIGAAHYDSDRGVYTGRLQLCADGYIEFLLNEFGGILINTSLNAHGQPIIYDNNDIYRMKIIQNRSQDS